jgi:hypothetical protein
MFAEDSANKAFRVYMLFIIVVSISANLPIATAKPSDFYNYKFIVDENGFTQVEITFFSTRSQGESWVFVPKSEFSPWTHTTENGEITYTLVNTKEKVEEDFYFYEVFDFSFVRKSSLNSFQMKIRFNMTGGALIIEPRGVFFSPQIGFDPNSLGDSKAEVLFPPDYEINKALIASSSGKSTPQLLSSRHVIFTLRSHVERLQIEFETAAREPIWKPLNQSVFSFNAVERYESYAQEILNLYDTVYEDFTELFNVTLESVDVQFFIPEFETLLTVGGFVPFSGQKLGVININIFFIRAVNGTIQGIALHELVHHFLWKAGLSPDFFLWFHEGVAQFISIETVIKLGYPGGAIEKERLEQGVDLFIRRYGEDFGFIEGWTPTNQPRDVSPYYVASYYVVSRLAEKYKQQNEFDLYERFFKQIHGKRYSRENYDWSPTEWLAFHLSMAANASVDLTLKQWGFNIRLLTLESNISQLISEAEEAIDGLSPVFQPYKLIAEFLYQQALLRLERGDIDGASQLLNMTISLANIAPLLTLLTLVVLFAIVAYILFRYTSEPSPEFPPLPPTYEETSA